MLYSHLCIQQQTPLTWASTLTCGIMFKLNFTSAMSLQTCQALQTLGWIWLTSSDLCCPLPLGTVGLCPCLCRPCLCLLCHHALFPAPLVLQRKTLLLQGKMSTQPTCMLAAELSCQGDKCQSKLQCHEFRRGKMLILWTAPETQLQSFFVGSLCLKDVWEKVVVTSFTTFFN